MNPPIVKPARRPVALKPTTLATIQTAFADEQWSNAANLAKQRFRVTKDPYYTSIECAAISQTDHVADRNAGRVLIEKMIKEDVTIADADALDLFEFACHGLDMKYSKTIGILRWRLAKALPKDQSSCTRCFEACVWNSDWKNAQQIAASLNANFINDRKFLFRYILSTYMYSLSDECPQGSKKIFGSLAKAHADKAFALRVTTAGKKHYVDRAANDESEASMWLSIRFDHCDPKENLKLFKLTTYSPLEFLKVGQMEPYWMAMCYLKQHKALDDIFQIGKCLLEEAISIIEAEASAINEDKEVVELRKLVKVESENGPSEAKFRADKSSTEKALARAVEKARPSRDTKANSYLAASCEHGLFLSLYEAARAQPDSDRAQKQVRCWFDKVIKGLAGAECLKPIFQTTHDLAALSVIFEETEQIPEEHITQLHTVRVLYLTDYICNHCDDPQCFVDTTLFLGRLSNTEITSIKALLSHQSSKCDNRFEGCMVKSLAQKIHFFVATTSSVTCGLCNNALNGSNCIYCLWSIAKSALRDYRSGIVDFDLIENVLPRKSTNPIEENSVIGAICLLKLSGLGRETSSRGVNPLHHVDIQLFLLAVIWLDTYVAASPPKSTLHSMILIKLYLLMGCVSRAKSLWERLDVKNALTDSLGLLYSDRLSSISPGLFIYGQSRDSPIEPFMSHITRALSTTTPKRIMDSLEMGNYSSIPAITSHAEKQTASCTLALGVVEERRGLRMKAGKVETSVDDQPLVRKLSIEHGLNDITDYGIFTIPDGKGPRPTHAILGCGPLPTGTRAHLGLLAERFLDLICFVQPKEYKSTKPGQVIQLDWEYAHGISSRLERDTMALLGVTDSDPKQDEKVEPARAHEEVKTALTQPELQYHGAIYRLASIVKNFSRRAITRSYTTESRDLIRSIISSIVEVVEGQTDDCLATPQNFHSESHTLHYFSGFHAMGMLRETIIAVKHTTNYLTNACEKTKSTSSTSNPSESAWVTTELKNMKDAAAKSESALKARIKIRKDHLNDMDGWRDYLRDTVLKVHLKEPRKDSMFKDGICDELGTVIPKVQVESWADDICKSWWELMKGWSAVKFE